MSLTLLLVKLNRLIPCLREDLNENTYGNLTWASRTQTEYMAPKHSPNLSEASCEERVVITTPSYLQNRRQNWWATGPAVLNTMSYLKHKSTEWNVDKFRDSK